MNIVFMGTPDFAVPCLQALFENSHKISAVFTQPDKPQGRKMVITPPPVKQKALELGLSVYQPQTLKDEQIYSILKDINPDIIVVVAYGKILPSNILDLPKFGCVNVHASLLPRHRGASPIQWSIVSGDAKTGVTTMLMDKGLDTGDILLTEETEIGPNETAGELSDRLSVIGASLILKTVDNIENITPVKQNELLSTYAPILKKEMGFIDFANKTAAEINCLIRGFNPKPGAYFMLNGKRIKVFASEVLSNTNFDAAKVISTDNGLCISCKNFTAIKLVTVQSEGSRPMNSADMLRGMNITVGSNIE